MRQTIKKLLSFVVSAVMVMMFAAPVLADSDQTKITAPSDAHTYAVYQIMTGDLSDGKLSNAKWGTNAYQSGAVSERDMTDIKDIGDLTSRSEMASAIAAYVDLESNPFGTISNGSSIDVPTGWYLIKDNGKAGEHAMDGDAYSLYIVKVVGDITIEPKVGVPTVDKKVQENSNGQWQNHGDYNFNEPIPYKITGTLPENYADYTEYFYKFTDTMDGALNYQNDAKVYVVNGENKTEVTDSFEIVAQENFDTFGEEQVKNSTVLTISCSNLKSIENVTINKDTKIVVEYTAKIDDIIAFSMALERNEGNGLQNKVDLQYSNNPNKEGTGKTPEVKTIVYTFAINVNKVKEDRTRLAGAEFTLYKKVGDNYVPYNDGAIFANGETETPKYKDGFFAWEGVDAGIYKIVETKVPDGYNKAEDTIVEIRPIYKADGTLDSLYLFVNGKQTEGEPLPEGQSSNDSVILRLDSWVCNKCSMVGVTVVNREGTTLPETGGMGTTLFYVLGSIMVLGAGVLLVSKRRADAE